MSCLTFLSENLVDDSTLSITTGAANAQFPLDNIKNESTTNKFRSVGNTVVFVVDLLQTRQIDTFALVGDTTSQLEITSVSVKTSVTNDFTSSTAINIPISAEFNIGYEYFTEVDHRFVEVTLTGSGSYAEVSNIFIGKKFDLTQNALSIKSFRYKHNDPSKIKSSDFGQKFINTFPYIKRIVGTIEFCTQTELDELDTIWRRHGRNNPFWMIVDSDSESMIDGNFKLAMYGYLEKMPGWRAVGGRLFTTSLEMDQVV